MTISQQAIDIAYKVEAFVRDIVIPYEQDQRRDHHGAPTDELVYEMRDKARAAGVLTPHILAGGGHLNQRETAVVLIKSGLSPLGPLACNTMAPDEGNMYLLGKVGSSGISTGPHLHLEIRASEVAGAAVIEPHAGACNNVASGWVDQRPYRDPAINQISTHATTPTLLGCPQVGTIQQNTDQPRYKDHFQPGEPITLLAAYRDQARGQVTQFRVLRPDQSVFTSWNFDSAEQGAPAVYSASYWYWNNQLPANAPHGLWTFEATYEGETKRHFFRVGDTTTAVGDMRGLIGAWYEPATSGQGMELHWINDNIALLFFYGHKDNGENFFLLGQRNGAFDFGQEVVFEMRLATGGRFNGLDPAAITRPVWGSVAITFVDCETAVAELDGLDGQQVLTLTRLGRTTGLGCD